jgi:hypothetical protein
MASGVVLAVGQTPIAAQELPYGQAHALQVAAKTSEPLYRIVVRVIKGSIDAYGEQVVAKPGMALEADIVLETRHAWEWVLEPLLAVKEKSKLTGVSAVPKQISE